MGRRNRFRWAIAKRIVRYWFRRVATKRRCRSVVYRTHESDDRAVRIGSACADCVCERCSVGKHGSPGRVTTAEMLYSVIVAPGDLKGDQIALTLITHAEKKGMSVLRGDASDAEFGKIVSHRLNGPGKRELHGIAALPCKSLRNLRAETNTEQRLKGDRLYCTLDSDMPGLPHHADVFATVPRPAEGQSQKTAWKAQRGRLLELLQQNISTPDEFRGGFLGRP